MKNSELKKLFSWIEEETEVSVSTFEHNEIVNSLIPRVENSDSDDSLEHLIFAPDPLTGLPSSDLGLLVKNRYNPDLMKYIEEKGIQAPHETTGYEDVDLSLVKSRRAQFGTERSEYYATLQKIAREGYDAWQKSISEKSE